MLEFARQADACRPRFGHGLLRGLDRKGTSGSVRGGWEHQLVHPWDQEEESARMKLETREADAGDRGFLTACETLVISKLSAPSVAGIDQIILLIDGEFWHIQHGRLVIASGESAPAVPTLLFCRLVGNRLRRERGSHGRDQLGGSGKSPVLAQQSRLN